MANVVETVKSVLEPALFEKGYDLWDVEYSKLGSDMILRILVDRLEGAISMDDLVSLTEIIGDLVDGIEPDPFPEAYMMDIASPGAERELKRDRDFDWAVGKFIHVDLSTPFQDQTSFDGELVAVTDDALTVAITVKAKRQLIEVPRELVTLAHLIIGMERILTTDADYQWALNKVVRVTTYQKIDGKKEFEGELAELSEDQLVIVDQEDQAFAVPRSAIAQARHANNF
ncbi:ribosome maturation factor [Weissella soli]|uniref:ribosome maturation factor n=1 Tax=Weissella soli TaxID=155866 RepID=UPI00359F745D